jgi:hypothetical protein
VPPPLSFGATGTARRLRTPWNDNVVVGKVVAKIGIKIGIKCGHK